MAQFSASDIDAAKKRVREMRDRASRFADETAHSADNEKRDEKNTPPVKNDDKGGSVPFDRSLPRRDDEGQDMSSLLILAIIMILSKEKADTSLILALLYLLF